jgi:hypothetical protein
MCCAQAPTLLEMLLRCWVQGRLGVASPEAGSLVAFARTLAPVVIDKFGAPYAERGSTKWAFAVALHAFIASVWPEGAVAGAVGALWRASAASLYAEPARHRGCVACMRACGCARTSLQETPFCRVPAWSCLLP